MIVVTGATGKLGGAVVEQLLQLVPADQVGVSVRDPERVTALRDRGVRVRAGDYADPAESFEGASAVLLVSAPLIGDELLTAHRSAVAAAVASGAKRIFYTSHMGANPSSPFPPARGHAATEEMLARSGVAYTALQNGYYATTVPMLLRQALDTGELRVPSDGPIAWTTHADLAAATARILIDGAFDGPTPPLTGPTALTMAEVAAIATRVTGRDIRHVVVSDDEYASGLPEFAATMLLGMFAASRDGDFAPADPTLASLIGRPATPLESFLRATLT